MSKNEIKLSLDLISSELIEFFQHSSIGIEKECLRISNNELSRSSHPIGLGSSLTNKYITTDFSESQLELITPPLGNNKESLKFLNDLHHFIHHKINDEVLWPFSIPPYILSDTDIPLAEYGESNLGLFKKIYRNGLSNRYGRVMQVISGIHYNFSFSDAMWKNLLGQKDDDRIKQVRSDAYFKLLRNALRFNWLIIYLFGASPLITRITNEKFDDEFQKLSDNSFFLPYATSLRMSDYGYTNIARSKLHVSLNSMSEYINDLKAATKQEDPSLVNLINLDNSILPQLNKNILQIENEYYAVARAKSNLKEYMRETSKLEYSGVDFIELRSIDLNPFTSCGIDLDTSIFLEIFCIYCMLADEECLSIDEIENIKNNDLLIATQGRKSGIKLNNQGKKFTVRDWGNEIFDQMFKIAELIEDENNEYADTLIRLRSRIEDPGLTPSSLILETIHDKKIDFHQLAMKISKENKSEFMTMSPNINENWTIFSEEANYSVERVKKIEADSGISFEEFLSQYENE